MSSRRTRVRLVSPRRRLYVRPSSSRRSTSRSTNGAPRRPIPIRARSAETAAVEPTRDVTTPDVIDLTAYDSVTCDEIPVVDLTSPVASGSGANDTSVIVIGRGEVGRPDGAMSRTLILSSDDSDDDELPALDIPKMTTPAPSPLRTINQPTISASPAENSLILQCPICMDDYKEIRLRGVHLSSTVCGHVFCTECIKNAVTQHGQCPLCRAKLRHKGYHTLHL